MAKNSIPLKTVKNQRNKLDLIGKRFGRLVVVGEAPRHISSSGKSTSRSVVCHCDCGNVSTISASNLMQGRSQSCGCGQRESITKHGLSRHPLYLILDGMKSRCYNENNIGYDNYGGRGITVCDEWLDDPCSFVEWGLQNGWEEGLVVDRKEVGKGYSPDNCRFVTRGLSSRNTRLIRSSNTSGFNGVSAYKDKWLAKIQYRNKTYRIGLFDDPKEAALARDAKAKELDAGHPLNFP